MIRKIIRIDEDKCNGCGACATACHEDAITMVDGKAKLLHDHYCDGLGDCLPVCPTGAISFETREAAAYDDAAVKANQAAKKAAGGGFAGCPAPARTPLPANPRRRCPQGKSFRNCGNGRFRLSWPRSTPRFLTAQTC